MNAQCGLLAGCEFGDRAKLMPLMWQTTDQEPAIELDRSSGKTRIVCEKKTMLQLNLKRTHLPTERAQLHPFQFVTSEGARESTITLFEKFRYFWEVAECRSWSPIRTILRDKSHIRLSTFGSDFHGELPGILRYIELRCAMHPRKGSTAEHLDELLIGFPTPNENARFHPLVGRVPNCDSMRHVFRGHPDDLRQSLWSELFQTNQANSCNRESSVRFHFEWRRYELLGCGRVTSKI